jgi:hypothetical protein
MTGGFRDRRAIRIQKGHPRIGDRSASGTENLSLNLSRASAETGKKTSKNTEGRTARTIKATRCRAAILNTHGRICGVGCSAGDEVGILSFIRTPHKKSI